MSENEFQASNGSGRARLHAAWSAFRAWLISPVTLAAAVAAVVVMGAWLGHGDGSVTTLERPFTVGDCRVEAVSSDGAIWVRPVGGSGELRRVIGAPDC